jgi:hypothetical protein
VIPQENEAGLIADEASGRPNRVTVPFGLGLNGKVEALFEVGQPFELLLGPGDVFVADTQILCVSLKMAAIVGLIPGGGHDADLFDTGVDRLLGDDLEHGLGQSVAVHKGEHGLLNRVEGRVLPGSSTSRRDDRLTNPHDESPVSFDRKNPGRVESD